MVITIKTRFKQPWKTQLILHSLYPLHGVNASSDAFETLINVGKGGLLFSDITRGVRRICKGTSGEHKIIYRIMCTPVLVCISHPLIGHLKAKTNKIKNKKIQQHNPNVFSFKVLESLLPFLELLNWNPFICISSTLPPTLAPDTNEANYLKAITPKAQSGLQTF